VVSGHRCALLALYRDTTKPNDLLHQIWFREGIEAVHERSPEPHAEFRRDALADAMARHQVLFEPTKPSGIGKGKIL
jgi:hypothetical protein